MKQVFAKKGRISVEEVPAPIANENEVLVQVGYSCISAGTEISSLKNSNHYLCKKVFKEPRNVKKVLGILRTEGLAGTVARLKDRLADEKTLGYSASGFVLETGEKINDIRIKDRVACAGAGVANHAGFIVAPRNLIVKVPENLSLELAATVTLGSIALQGVRRAEPKLGEFVAVIGLGILGQLTSQMLKANGCRVIGFDPDSKRVDIALSLGMDRGLDSAEDDVVEAAVRFSQGHGVDSVIITASTESSEVINRAMEMCRKKGKIVIVGAVGLNLKRDEFYRKELDVFISTSYGPGRYDEEYELKGRDYPYPYVRWTENRNMEEYLRLLKDRKLNIKPLIEKVYPVEKAPRAYQKLRAATPKPLIVLLKYDQESISDKKVVISRLKPARDKINLALIGGSGFAKAIHLPNLRRLSNLYRIQAVVSKTGSNAKSIAKRYGASYATTDYREVLKDRDVEMVLISTRHNSHARIAIEAARAGKAIFVEKPMALNRKELNALVKVLEETKVPFLVGFNRRFSPFARKIKEAVEGRLNPMIINYRVNAGYLPPEHWVHTEEGGGRNIGEAVHFYDLFNFFTESEVGSISAFSIDPRTEQYFRNDNFVATIKYQDGSVCNLVYTALGSKDYPKEEMNIYFDGKIINLTDYRELNLYGGGANGLKTGVPDKGHREELIELARSRRSGDGYPIPLWQLIQATDISFTVEKLLGGEVSVDR